MADLRTLEKDQLSKFIFRVHAREGVVFVFLPEIQALCLNTVCSSNRMITRITDLGRYTPSPVV